MIKKKIVFMGTPDIAKDYLAALIENKINIYAVYTQPPRKQSRGMKLKKTPVHLLAETNNITVFHPEKFDEYNIDKLKKLNPDLIIVMAYGKLLPKEVLELPQNGCINVHLSLLPRWRGAAPIEYALMNGDNETGITLIKLVEKLDSGPIIVQKKIDIQSDDNKLKLSKILTLQGIKLLIDTLPKIIKSNIQLKNQDEKYATYANKIVPEDRKINFKNTSFNIINQIKAHGPKPGAWFILNNERIKIIDAKPGIGKGEVSTILNKNFEIGCYDGSIDPLILQREGKKIVKKSEFLKGFNFKVNSDVNV